MEGWNSVFTNALTTNVAFSCEPDKEYSYYTWKTVNCVCFSSSYMNFQKLKMSRSLWRQAVALSYCEAPQWKSSGRQPTFPLLSSEGNPKGRRSQLFCKPDALASMGTNMKCSKGMLGPVWWFWEARAMLLSALNPPVPSCNIHVQLCLISPCGGVISLPGDRLMAHTARPVACPLRGTCARKPMKGLHGMEALSGRPIPNWPQFLACFR